MKLTLTRFNETNIHVTVNGLFSHIFDVRPLIIEDAALLSTNIRVYGEQLYTALFPPDTIAQQILTQIPEYLFLVAADKQLDAIPWEYLYGPNGFLVLDYQFVRGLPDEQRLPVSLPSSSENPYIIAVPSQPLHTHIPPLRVENEWLRLKEQIRAVPYRCILERVSPPTLEHAGSLLAHQRGNILHFMGHGIQEEERAVLCFEQENGGLALADARQLIQHMHNNVSLVTLNACESARHGPTPMHNIALTLVQHGIPYAIGMRFNVSDEDARIFSRTFYEELVRGTSVEEALRQSRLALEAAESARQTKPTSDTFLRSWLIGTPVLYTALAGPTSLFQATTGHTTIIEPQPHIEVSLLPRADGGFQGRQVELLQLGNWLTGKDCKHIITIHGGGGQGKTALAREVAERFAWAWPDGIWATSFETIPTRATFIIALAQFLGIATQTTLDPIEIERQVFTLLASRRLLLILDNIETLVDAIAAHDTTALALAQVLQQLPGPSVSLLTTSRVPLDWNGEEVLELSGLTPGEGTALFQQCTPRRRHDVDTTLVWKLSEQLAGHPLALRLLGSAFDVSNLSLPGFLQEYEMVLLQAQNKYQYLDHRHRSLAACIELSVRSLSTSAYELLRNLWVFHAPFLPTTAITLFDPDIQETEHILSPIRQQLETLQHRGLLSYFPIATADTTIPYYYLLPTTRWYIEHHMTLEDDKASLLARFGSVYAHLAQRLHSLLADGPGVSIARYLYEDLEHGIAYTEGIVLGNYLYDWGWISYQLKNPLRAIELLEKAQEIAQEQQDSSLEARVLNALALIQGYTGNPEMALILHQQALAHRQSQHDREGEATTLHNIALIYDNMGQSQEALQRYQNVLPLMRAMDNRVGEAYTISHIASLYHHMGQTQLALEQYQQAYLIMQEIGNKGGETDMLINIAAVHDTLGQPQEAIARYQQALPLAQSLGNASRETTVLENMASMYQKLGDRQEALQRYRQILPVRIATHDKRGEAVTLNNIAQTYYQIGQLREALDTNQQALALRQETHDRVGEAITLNSIAQIYSDWGQPQKALTLHKQVLAIRQETHDLPGEATTLNNIAMIHRKIGQQQDALTHYHHALSIMQQSSNRVGEATVLGNIAVTYHELGRYEEALTCYQNALLMSREAEDRPGEAVILDNIATLYGELGHVQDALQLYQQVLTLRKALGDKAGEATTLNNIGAAYKELGKVDEALTYYEQALPLMQDVGNRAGEAATLNNIALAKRTKGYVREALSIYQRALSIMQEVEDHAGAAITLNNMSASYKFMGQTTEALTYAEQALALTRTTDDRSGEATVLNTLASIQWDMNQSKEALTLLQQALAIRNSLGDRKGCILILNNIAEIFWKNEHFQDAIRYADEALNLIREEGDRQTEKDTLLTLATAYDKMGQFQEALSFYEQALALMNDDEQA